MASIVVLPDPVWADRDAIVAGVPDTIDVQGATATEMCADLLRRDLEPPLVVVAHGAACAALPAVALAQRTAHRRVAGYVLIDPDAPSSSDTWPDAPVAVVTSDTQIARMSTLRGWSVSDADVLDVIGDVSRT